MSSDSEATISRRISQRSETETESEAFVLPQTEKLPQLDQFDPNFEELHDVPEGMILSKCNFIKVLTRNNSVYRTLPVRKNVANPRYT